jgi:ABC-type dipeptide/oligopeptide/nickel transport system ATPase subunit
MAATNSPKDFFGNRATKNVAGKAKNIEARIDHILTEEKSKSRTAHGNSNWTSAHPTINRKMCSSPIRSQLATRKNPVADRHQPVHPRRSAGGVDRCKRLRQNNLHPHDCRQDSPAGGFVPSGRRGQTRLHGAGAGIAQPRPQWRTNHPSVSSINETETRNFLHYFLFKGDAALRPAGDLSFGERARLQLALLVAQGCTFLILDEPINHLDIPSRERFEEALENFNGTILAVVHDRSFIERFATDVWVAKDGKILK